MSTGVGVTTPFRFRRADAGREIERTEAPYLDVRTSTFRLFFLLSLAALTGTSSAQVQTVPFKVYITELWQLDINQDIGIGVIGDFYAKVTINGVAHDNKGACDDDTSTGLLVPLQLFKNFTAISDCKAKTPWVFTQQVPAGQPVHLKIQIFDEDTISDDEADLKVGDGDAIELDIDPATGQWSADIAWPQNCSRPNLNLGGNNANVCWQASFDSDDDGLLDVWERFGVDTDNDGMIDINLASLGANPLHKDVFVEADYLQAATHLHDPGKDAIERIVTSFANAPLANVDGTTGVQLHVDVGPLYGAAAQFSIAGTGGVVGSYGDLGGGNAIAEAGNETIDAFGSGKGPGADFADLKTANFNAIRETVFRYAIFGHQTNGRVAVNDCTSGLAHRESADFLVTLGGLSRDGKPCWGTNGGAFSVGDTFQQGGTFMHELGHMLGLPVHGGDVEVHNKPNYLSVMNYAFQFCKVPTSIGLLPGQCDYSRLVTGAILPPLHETNLDECVGIGGGLGFGKVDWNGNAIYEGESRCGAIFANSKADVNNDGVCVKSGPNGRIDSVPGGDDEIKDDEVHDGKNRFCNTTARTGTDDIQVVTVGNTPTQPDVLNSFDDWGHLDFNLLDTPSGTSSGAPVQEADPNTIEDARRFMSGMMAPLVAIDQSGPATARPGEVVSYDVRVTNTGRGPALSTMLQTTHPDGSIATFDLGAVSVGAELSRLTTFTVPANACPGDLTSARASASFTDFPGTELTATGTTPLQILDVAPPAFEVSLSPNILWPPNHKFVDVTTTLTSTDNCDRSPAVTLVSITSNEPADKKEPDIQGAAFGTDDRTFSLRAERETGHDRTGRVYTVTYRVTDASNNATVKSATVTVPANNGGR